MFIARKPFDLWTVWVAESEASGSPSWVSHRCVRRVITVEFPLMCCYLCDLFVCSINNRHYEFSPQGTFCHPDNIGLMRHTHSPIFTLYCSEVKEPLFHILSLKHEDQNLFLIKPYSTIYFKWRIMKAFYGMWSLFKYKIGSFKRENKKLYFNNRKKRHILLTLWHIQNNHVLKCLVWLPNTDIYWTSSSSNLRNICLIRKKCSYITLHTFKQAIMSISSNSKHTY